MKFKLLLTFCFGLLLFSCSDDDGDDVIPTLPTAPNPTPDAPSAPTVSFNGADGTLIAIESESSTPAGTITIGTAVAVFQDNGTIVDVGTVKAENKSLKKNDNNSYTFTPSLTDQFGISFSAPISWEVSGGSGFAAINEENTSSFPSVGDLTAGETVSKASDYTVSIGSVQDADSILFVIGDVVHTLPGNTVSHTFTANDLSGLTNGTSFISVAAYNFNVQTLSSKEIYLVNEKVVQKMVTVQ